METIFTPYLPAGLERDSRAAARAYRQFLGQDQIPEAEKWAFNTECLMRMRWRVITMRRYLELHNDAENVDMCANVMGLPAASLDEELIVRVAEYLSELWVARAGEIRWLESLGDAELLYCQSQLRNWLHGADWRRDSWQP
jgi:hypothetical protein